MRFMTTGEFVEKARKAFGDIHDYSKVSYTGCNDIITVICIKHGEFTVKPSVYMRNKDSCGGCAGCKKEFLQERQDSRGVRFLEMAVGLHGDRYDYSLVDYVDSSTKVKIICKKHGVFEQNPNKHLLPHNCPDCSYDKRSTPISDLILDSMQIHKGRYDYSRVSNDALALDKVEIGCPEHGFITQELYGHSRGKGCRRCGHISTRTTNEEFIRRGNARYDNKFNYSEVDYLNNYSKVKIICPHHGAFWSRPHDHLHMVYGCGKCAAILRNADDRLLKLPTLLYYIKITDLDGTEYWKIGVTTKTVNERFANEKKHIKLQWIKPYKTGYEAYDVEQYILCKFSKYRPMKSLSVMKHGYTEIFNKDVLRDLKVTW